MFYRVCPCCGSNLDPGERCECVDIEKKKNGCLLRILDYDCDGQIRMKVEDMTYGA